MQRGVPNYLGYRVTKVHLVEGRVAAVTAVGRKEKEISMAGEHFISSMPIKELIAAMNPPPPRSVVEASQQLRYRDFLTVGLALA